MQTKPWLIFSSVLVLFILTACGGASTAPTASTSQEATATNTSIPEPTQAVVEDTTRSEGVTPIVEVATATSTVEVIEEPTEEIIVEEPTEEMIEATVETMPEEIDWLTVEGKTDNNLTYLGNPDASVTIIDYSDFL